MRTESQLDSTPGSPRYISVRVELLRHGADEGFFRPDIAYLVQVGDKPVREFKIPLGQVQFLDNLKGLDYHAAREARDRALEALSAAVTDVLRPEEIGLPAAPVQIDLVVSAAELAALPFELAKDGDGGWLFTAADRDVEITRRTRLDFGHRLTRWRAKPHVLFVVAAPSGAEVPAEEHKKALRKALWPWIEPLKGVTKLVPDDKEVLKIIEGASLDAIREACEEAAESDKPFTHVHVLAHGIAVDSDHRQHFGLALHGKDGKLAPVKGTDIAKALEPIIGECSVVTFTACNGGNAANTILPESSPAQTLHAAGIPVVVGCQLPMTSSGSTLFVEHFFTPLFRGGDVRAALHAARRALYEGRARTGQDWAGLVGYVRLPETYADHLIDVALEADLASLRTVQHWFDLLVMRAGPTGSPDPKDLDYVERQFRERIARLDRRRGNAETSRRRGVLEENLGLLGSANSRNRRIFDDRAGLLAAHNRSPTFCQTYDRDMGGGRVVFLKEANCPIMVDDMHWGNMRLAYEA